MYTDYSDSSLVTSIIPEKYVQHTIDILNSAGYDVMNWSGRGSLKDTRWYRKFLPMISPEKGLLRVITNNCNVDNVIQLIVQAAKLDRQATGAIFALPAENLSIGGLFHTTCNISQEAIKSDQTINQRLEVINCIVERNKADKISRAAIDAGSHGPIVHYGEGRGLRDRLGWLRITKQREKEVLTVISETQKSSQIFDAMASAGNIDLPGGGFMYQMSVAKGMFNLPSYYSGANNNGDMYQIIGAIDHLMGHNDWRESAASQMANHTHQAGLEFLKRNANNEQLEPQSCVSVIIDREHEEQVTDMLLDAGANGVSVNFAQLHTSEDKSLHNEVKLVAEYGILRSVVGESVAQKILAEVKEKTAASDIEDACVFSQSVSRVLTYTHHPRIEYRRTAAERNAA